MNLKQLIYATEVSLFFNLILVYTNAFIPPWYKFQNSAQYKLGSYILNHSHIVISISLITIVLVTSQMLLQQAKEIICPVVRSFSKKMQSHTAQIRHKNCCSCFIGNFQAILAIVLTAEATSGRSPNSRIIRMWKWFYQNACKCKSPIPTPKEYLNSCQLGTNSSVCLGTMVENNDP